MNPTADPPSRNRATLQRSRLRRESDILSVFQHDVRTAGLVGEERAATLSYLTAVSALMTEPASMVLKGPSSAGKNKVADSALAFVPEAAVKRLTSMSERALFYSDDPIKHRALYVAEGDGVTGGFLASVVRSLLSEGSLRYDTVDHTAKEGLHGKSIVKEGPAAFLTTTTLPSLDGELETRLLSVPVNDSKTQTRAILLAQAARMNGGIKTVDYGRWHHHYEWLAEGCRAVEVPFGHALADAIPDAALTVQMRRAFKLVLIYTATVALLHRADREQRGGRVVATVADYAAVRPLLNDLLAQQAEQAVSPETRETVDAVRKLSRLFGSRKGLSKRVEPAHAPSLTELASVLDLDKSTVSRRVRVAVDAGYLRNAEDHDGKPARLYLAAPLPTGNEVVLPDPSALDRCTVAPLQRGTPSKPNPWTGRRQA